MCMREREMEEEEPAYVMEHDVVSSSTQISHRWTGILVLK